MMVNQVGTAGAPMLGILENENIKNVVVIVTRYFGGVLLGTGGLLRAYTGGLQDALSKVQLINKDYGMVANFDVSYGDFEKLKYYFKNSSIAILESDYGETIKVHFEITEDKLQEILKKKDELNFKILNYEIERKCFILI